MKIVLQVCCLAIHVQLLLAWTTIEHKGMAKSAEKVVLHLDSTKHISSVQVPVKFDVMSNIATLVFAGAGDAGMIGAFIGSIVDLGLSEAKMKINTTMTYPPPKTKSWTEDSLIMQACYDPDTYEKDAAVFGDGKVIITHMYTPNGIGFADYFTEYFYDKAVTEFKSGQRLKALAYLGYAGHYLTDAALPSHDEADYLNMKNIMGQAILHSEFEDWIEDNWNSVFQATSDSAAEAPMTICDIGASVRSMALESAPDFAEWLTAWGSYLNTSPADPDKMAELTRRTIYRCVPRLAGLYLKFKTEAMGSN